MYVGALHVGLDATCVQGIQVVGRVVPVPLAPRSVAGIVNVRGEILTAIDLRRVLEIGGETATEGIVNVVVVDSDDGPVSFLVDQVGEVMEVSENGFEPAPETLPGSVRRVIRGAYKLAGGLLLVLDVDQTIQSGV